MITNKQLKNAIKKTIKFMSTHKWGQFLNYNPTTDKYCVLGAFRKANGGNPHTGADTLAEQFKLKFFTKFHKAPIKFNDTPNQKKQRVVEKLEKLHDLL